MPTILGIINSYERTAAFIDTYIPYHKFSDEIIAVRTKVYANFQITQVNKIEVQYDKTSKQVDVQALKITLWDHVQESAKLPVQVCRDFFSIS